MPLIVSGPGVKRQGIVTDQVLHVTDIMPTILDYAGIRRPQSRNGHDLAPLYGRSWRPYLEATTHQPIRGAYDPMAFEMIECKAVIKGDWKILLMVPPYGQNEWHLYNMQNDPQELNNVADKYSEKLAEMKAEWEAYALSVGYIEASGDLVLEHMSPEEFFSKYGV